MSSVKYSDNELIAGLISRDERILKEIYRSYFKSIHIYVLSNRGNDEDAKDLFQEAMLVIFQKSRDGNLNLTCSLGTYFFSVSKYIWLKELAKRKWVSHSEYPDVSDIDEDIEMISEKNERLIFYQRCFDSLSENCRKVLLLFSEGMSIRAITSALGFRSDQHTRNRRYRCKSALIKNIRSQYDYNLISYANNTVD